MSGAPPLAVRGIEKAFGALRVLKGVSFSLEQGQVLSLLGDNGAGKSTLANCVAGLYRPDAGRIEIDGRPVELDSPQRARDLGIETVHQGLALVPRLDVAANLFLNREVARGPGWLGLLRWLDKREMYATAERVLQELGVRVPSVRQPVESLSGGQRQAVAIGRAVAWGRHIVILDEPTAALGVEQSRQVNELIKSLRGQGVSVLLISHNMQHVLEVSDRAVVLRHGEVVGDVRISEVDQRDLVELITGAARRET